MSLSPSAVSPDTVELILDDFSVQPDSLLEVTQPTVKVSGEVGASYPLFKVGNRTHEGVSAYYNDPDRGFYFDIRRSAEWEPGQVRAQLHFSVPNVAHGANYHPVDQDATRGAVRSVERYLRDVGIHTDVSAAILRRLDTFRNVLPRESYQCYRPVMPLLGGSRMLEHEYESGFRWDNSQWEICVYDKIAEMLGRKITVATYPANTIRFEKRLKRRRKVEKVTGLRTVADLLEGFDSLAAEYERSMRRQLFNRPIRDLPVFTESDIGAFVDAVRSTGGRYWQRECLLVIGMDRVLERDAFEVLASVVADRAGNRMAKTRMLRELEDLRRSVAAVGTVKPSTYTLRDLHEELRDKVLKAA